MQPDENVPFQQGGAEADCGHAHGSWTARLDLGFGVRHRVSDSGDREAQRGTVLKHRHQGPLRIQKALYPEGPGTCHAIIVHPPGGIAGGDRLDIVIDCAPDAHGLVTTPSAAKWYGAAPENPASQTLRVDLHGALEWLPQETIIFNRAQVRSDILIRAAQSGRMIGWDHLIFGRHRSGESFDEGCMRQSLRIEIDGRIVWHDRLVLEGSDALFNSPIGLRGEHTFATLWALVPENAHWTESVIETLRAAVPTIAWTLLHGRLLVGRILARPLELKPLMTRAWESLRPIVVGIPAVAPRLWAT